MNRNYNLILIYVLTYLIPNDGIPYPLKRLKATYIYMKERNIYLKH